jgi:hypothetical protein
MNCNCLSLPPVLPPPQAWEQEFDRELKKMVLDLPPLFRLDRGGVGGGRSLWMKRRRGGGGSG